MENTLNFQVIGHEYSEDMIKLYIKVITKNNTCAWYIPHTWYIDKTNMKF